MRVTARWATEDGGIGRIPGRFATVQEAEEAALKFMTKYPKVTTVAISHETGGWVRDVSRPPATGVDETREALKPLRERVEREYPNAREYEPERLLDGTLIGFTFLANRRYGWVTLAGAYARGLEPYRSVAAELLPYAVEQEERDAARGRS